MSDAQTTQPAEPEYVPQNVLASEEPPLQAPEEARQEPQDGAEEKPEADTAEEARRAERRRESARIGQLTRQKYEERARADALAAELRALRQQIQPQQADAPITQEQFNHAVRQEAAQLAAKQADDERFKAWDEDGIKEYGRDKFRDACKVVAEMASDEQRTTLKTVAMDLDGGQRALMELADDPDEAERILALPPHRMALALAKLAQPAAAPARQQSRLPPPIRPPAAGRARGEPDPNGSMDDYKRWSEKQQWNRY